LRDFRPVQLQASFSGSTSLTYRWTGPNNFVSTQQNATVTPPNQTGTYDYVVVATDPASGCTATQTVSVRVDAIVATAAAAPTAICGPAGPVQLSGAATGGTGPYAYRWTGRQASCQRSKIPP
jgi:hypothetical protein